MRFMPASAGVIRVLQFMIALTYTSGQKDKDTCFSDERSHGEVLKYCLYDDEPNWNFNGLGCHTLDINCPSGNHIQIKRVKCGMSQNWLRFCDSEGQVNCATDLNCCTSGPKDMDVSLLPGELQSFCSVCNNTDKCRESMNLNRLKVKPFGRLYCLVEYVCQRDNLSFVESGIYNNSKDEFNVQTTSNYPEISKSTQTITTVIISAVAGLIVIAAIGIILLWRWKRQKNCRPSNTSSGNSAVKSGQYSVDRTSNKYETIDLSRSKNAGVGSKYNCTRNSLTINSNQGYDSNNIYNEIDDNIKAEENPYEPAAEESDVQYNKISLARHVIEKKNQHNTLYGEAMPSTISDEQNFSEIRGNEMQVNDALITHTKTEKYENRLEEGNLQNNPYFILEKCDQYNHLHTGHKKNYDSSDYLEQENEYNHLHSGHMKNGDSIIRLQQENEYSHLNSGHMMNDDSIDHLEQENEYNKTYFAKPILPKNPNYGVLKNGVSERGVSDATISHLDEDIVRKPEAPDEYSHIELRK